MKKLICALFFAVLCALPAAADVNLSDDFGKHFGPGSNLRAYNKDIINLIGISDFHAVNPPTFPGFNLGVLFNAVKTSGDNNISSEDYMSSGFISASTKLPVLDFGFAVRGGHFNGLKSIGGGLTYNKTFFEILHASIGGFYDHASTDYYSLNHYSITAMASTDFLVFTPFVGAGYDWGDLSTRRFDQNRSSNTSAARYTIGTNVQWVPMFYLFGAYTHTHGNGSFNGGVGFSF